MWGDFKKFAFKGNVVDMAVGVVIGAAFGSIVKSIVDNLIMPPIGVLTGGVDFSELYVVLKAPSGGQKYATADELVKAGGVALRYGAVINTVISFFLIAIAVFVLVRILERAMRKQPPDPATRDCPECLMAIPVAAKRCGHCAQVVAS